MAGDFEDLHDIENLSDRELRDLVREHLEASTDIDTDPTSKYALAPQV